MDDNTIIIDDADMAMPASVRRDGNRPELAPARIGDMVLPARVFSRPDLSSTAKLVYGVIRGHIGPMGTATIASRTIGAIIGRGRTRAQEAVRELDRARLIAVDRSRGIRHYVYRLP